MTDQMLKWVGFDPSRIAVAALNPSVGDGVMGMEEIEIISPAIAAAKETGITVEGPFLSDTLY